MRRAMVSKNFLQNAAACRELFFSEELPEPELARYQGLLREHASEVAVINVRSAKCILLTAHRNPLWHLFLQVSPPRCQGLLEGAGNMHHVKACTVLQNCDHLYLKQRAGTNRCTQRQRAGARRPKKLQHVCARWRA